MRECYENKWFYMKYIGKYFSAEILYKNIHKPRVRCMADIKLNDFVQINNDQSHTFDDEINIILMETDIFDEIHSNTQEIVCRLNTAICATTVIWFN